MFTRRRLGGVSICTVLKALKQTQHKLITD